MATHFVRKRELTKKQGGDSKSTLGESVLSGEKEETSSGLASVQSAMHRMAVLVEKAGSLEVQSWEKESSELMGFFLESQRFMLVSQQLAAQRECMVAVNKYQQELRRKGLDLTEDNCSLTLSLFKKILE
jgi:hypothetical protein